MYVIHRGDCLATLRNLPTQSVDSIVTDPPYGIAFQGRKWDYDVPKVDVWAECLRVLKPGGQLLAFASTRTQHRMAGRIEDAGFEIRDMLAWVYGSGFPKSRDVSSAMELYQTGERRPQYAPKASPEVYQVTAFLRQARDRAGWTNRRIDALFGTNGMAGHWTSAGSQPAVPSISQWAILKAAIGFGPEVDSLVEVLAAREHSVNDGQTFQTFLSSLAKNRNDAPPAGDWGTALKPAMEPLTLARKPPVGSVTNNVRMFGTGALHIGQCRVPDSTSAATPSRWPANLLHDGSAAVVSALGTASRFFYCPKASTKDREAGNNHPTVKPTDLMRYLCRLVTPPGGTVLDPFMGSGSTGKAALLEGFNFIGCELSDQYADIAEGRMARALRAEAKA